MSIRPNRRAIVAWRDRGSKVVQWEPVAQEYRDRKASQTLAAMSVETVAEAALYMHAGLGMLVKEVTDRFGMHNAWFNDLVLWCRLVPEAQRCFSLASFVPDRLPLADVRIVEALRSEKQASAAGNLLKDRQTKKRPKIVRGAGG